MIFRIDNWYGDKTYGTLKFLGIKDGNLIFSQWEKSFVRSGKLSGWKETGQRINLDPKFQQFRVRNKQVRSILPPE